MFLILLATAKLPTAYSDSVSNEKMDASDGTMAKNKM